MTELERALAAIRELILRGLLKSMRTERDLADTLHMDRSPVREALAILTGQGLIEQFPHVGFRTRVIDAREAMKVLRLQLGIEMRIVVDLAHPRPPREKADMSSAFKKMVAMAEQTDLPGFMEKETDFHVELALAAGYDTAIDALYGIRDRLQMFFAGRSVPYKEYAVPVLGACQRLIGAIALGAADLAAVDLDYLLEFELALVKRP